MSSYIFRVGRQKSNIVVASVAGLVFACMKEPTERGRKREEAAVVRLGELRVC